MLGVVVKADARNLDYGSNGKGRGKRSGNWGYEGFYVAWQC